MPATYVLPNGATAVSVIGDGNCWFRSVLLALAINKVPVERGTDHMTLRQDVVRLASSSIDEVMFVGTDAGSRRAWVSEHSKSGTYSDELIQQYTALLLDVTIRSHVGTLVHTYNKGCPVSIDVVMVGVGRVYNHFDVYTTKSVAEVNRVLATPAPVRVEVKGRAGPVSDSDYARSLAQLEEQNVLDAEYARSLVRMEEQSVLDAQLARAISQLA